MAGAIRVVFYALGIGLGFATWLFYPAVFSVVEFLCPRYRAGLCDVPMVITFRRSSFYALDIGLGFATSGCTTRWSARSKRFLCPRYRAGLCDGTLLHNLDTHMLLFLCPRYRAGLCDHAIVQGPVQLINFGFLCPRYRAGLCDCTLPSVTSGANAVVSMPSISGWALRRSRPARTSSAATVSMPSISGWALRLDYCNRHGKLRSSVSMPSISG